MIKYTERINKMKKLKEKIKNLSKKQLMIIFVILLLLSDSFLLGKIINIILTCLLVITLLKLANE